ncbi:PASTA domain-containing protein [Nocardioides immobilis]|uniref:PASTA domain-containing protein n=1 Tax=Nocardioides immobilis TaxID=2049295 RepID=A0A417XRT0_9ACTN|nr:PASTA domain-containing protein [Nocardioides immobilis]RHW22780.1 PASTA domain-containing protein [Nocardioides immobilis]
MRAIVAAISSLALFGLVACGSDEAADMPAVEGERLDLALSDIDNAGFSKDDVEIVGGGTFGVVDESNWQVCLQDPAAGEPIGSSPRLTVDRTCGDLDHGSPEPDSVTNNDDQGGDADDSASSTFTMPALVGLNLQDAQDTLQALGSYLLTQTDATGMERFQVLDSNWKVCYQDPQPGAPVPLETLVELGAVKLDERCP